MSEPTESDVGALLDAAARYFSEPGTQVIAAHYVQTACNIARPLAESWLRQRKRIAALEADVVANENERNLLIVALAKLQQQAFDRADQAIRDINHSHLPQGYDAALRRIDAEVARCYGIEHP